MCFRVALHSSLRIALVLFVGLALLPVPCVPILVSAIGQGQSQDHSHRNGSPPRPGKPEGAFPNVEDMQNESLIEREPPAPIPSTVRSQRNSGKPWDGRRVGDPEPQRGEDHTGGHALRAHARHRLTSPPLLYEDQFIQNSFSLGLARSASYDETLYWNYQFRAAYNNSAESLKLAAIELGRTVFESAEYAARARSAHWYVYDLYKTYLMRDPDSGGWASWEATVSTNGREYVRRGFEESTEFATLMANVVPSGSPSSTATSLISARVDPRNQPGNGMLTRDAAWSVSLLSLPGRNGLDLGLSLSYSSMVWTRSGPYIYFDEDNGFPSPGFRLGFPTVQRKVFDVQTSRKSYLLITGGGQRVELRQVGTSSIYEAGDSSYLQITDNGSSLLLRDTSGTQMALSDSNGEYRCTSIKDRNGNYLTINYNPLGHITNVIDTLGRVINFNYDTNANLISITQAWNGQPAHQWVSFGWGTRTMQSSFSGAAVVGTANGTVLPVITQVALNDTSYFTFDYTNSMQVLLVKKYFGAVERNATNFTYETPGSDVPRLLSTSVSAQNWTGINGVPSQVTTQYSVGSDGACVVTAPDGTIYKEYYGTGWQRGLATLSEIWSGGVRQKWTTTAWTQDNTSVGYEMNPRVNETNIYDVSGNRRRTVIDYGPYAAYGLTYGVHEYAADGVSVIRETFTDYNLSQAYIDRRIIGLVAFVHMTNGPQYQTKISYEYDDPARLHGVPAAATQHDVNYNLSFTARGNVTAVSRWDVNDINNAAKKLTSYTDYYNTGTPISTTDPSGHQNNITYADSFSDSVMRNTFAYPTTLTDADNFSSFMQYNFDFGATTRTQSPTPAGQSQGAIQTMTYNNLGQLERITTTNNGAYKRFWYGADYTASYATVNNVTDEAYAAQIVDGLGRVIVSMGNHPGSYGGYTFVNTIYNQMGRVSKVSNPTEVNSSWAPSGDDTAGIYYTQQTYDWKGRPLITTNPDGTTREASYAGCGCAGGEVTTFTDEGTLINVAKKRQQKVYADVFGRTVKTEVLNWDGNGPNGTGGTVYTTTVRTYNARDQITAIKQYAGTEASSSFQESILNYDGYGRLSTRHVPEQDAGKFTTWTYNADDTVQTITDARGATATHGYNNRHLLTGITYSAPVGITATAAATFGYDAAGNKTSMTDGLGSKTYGYDQLSQLRSETRVLTGVGSFTLSYDYNLQSQLKKITDASNTTINYSYNVAGQLNGVTGSDTLVGNVSTYASGLQYRAFGGLKQLSVGNLSTSFGYNARTEVTNFNISGVVNENYDYYNDGRLKFVHNTTDNNFDRVFSYDHVGRLTSAGAGGAARGDIGDVPFYETFNYNPFGNLEQRETETWGNGSFFDAGTFVNHRRAGWGYDASGRITTIDSRTYTYDAAGRNINLTGQTLTPTSTISTATQSGFDGEGNRVRENSGTSSSMTLKYYLRSSVLGNAVIEELNSSGQKQFGYVYTPSGIQLATQTIGQNFVKFIQTSPLNTTERGVLSTGSISRVEFDAVGAKVAVVNLTPPNRGGDAGNIPMGGLGSLDTRYGALENPGGGCTLDGVYVPCYMAMRGEATQVVYVDPYYAATSRGLHSRQVWVDEDTSTAVRIGNENILTIYPGPGGHFEYVDDPDDVLETSTQKPTTPQTALPLPSDLKDRISAVVNNPNSDCAGFIKRLISEAEQIDGTAFSSDPLALFKRVEDQAGFKLKTTSYGGVSNREGNKRVVYITPVSDSGDARVNDHSLNAYAVTALNELMHHGKKSDFYSDRTLAQAIFPLLTSAEQLAHPLPKSRKAEVNSRYFHPLFNQHCKSPTGE